MASYEPQPRPQRRQRSAPVKRQRSKAKVSKAKISKANASKGKPS
jgi:hypothetical protein